MRKIYFLFLFILLTVIKVNAQPVLAAPTPPARDAAEVISLFSNSYANVTVDTWSAVWDIADLLDIQVAGNDTKRYTNLQYCGIEFSSSTINVSSMGTYHVDIWTPDATPLKVKLVDFGANGLYAGGDDKVSIEYVLSPAPTPNTWASYDIPLTSFTGLDTKAHLAQMLFVGSGTATIYVDNIYFWKSSSTPSLSNFNVPAKNLGDAAFSLTPPTSNSPGAFSYTSSNPDVATIAGDVVTIVGAGTSLITANQAAAGGYTAGTISANLIVSFPPPSVAAPIPAPPADKVISLFSDSYTNIAGTDWYPNWGQSTVVSDIQVASNNTKKYEFLNYQGIQLANSLDVSAANYLHVDIWTPNCTAFEISLIKTTPAPTVEQPVTVNPTQAGWNSFDIPLTSYNNVPLDKIGQIKLVGTPSGTSTVYLDNLYFWTGSLLASKLVNFTAVKNGNATQLAWKATNETGVRGYSLERSANSSNWSEISFIKTNNGNYSFTDHLPGKGMNYYRLKEVENNGSINYSAVVSVMFDKAGQGVSITPNPARGTVFIQVNKLENSTTSLSLVNASGQKVLSMMLKKETEKSQVKMDISKLPAGVYMVVLNDGHSVLSQKLVIE